MEKKHGKKHWVVLKYFLFTKNRSLFLSAWNSRVKKSQNVALDVIANLSLIFINSEFLMKIKFPGYVIAWISGFLLVSLLISKPVFRKIVTYRGSNIISVKLQGLITGNVFLLEQLDKRETLYTINCTRIYPKYFL